jgi:hypothetical protein
MADPSFVLDLPVLVSQGLVRMGTWLPDGRIRFEDPASRRVWGEVACTVDTRRPDATALELRYQIVRTAERVALGVPLRMAAGRARGFRWRFLCPLGCGRPALRLHLPGGASRFGCRRCHRSLLRRSEGPPAIRPDGRLQPAPRRSV